MALYKALRVKLPRLPLGLSFNGCDLSLVDKKLYHAFWSVSDCEESSFSDSSPLTCRLSRLLSSREQSMGWVCFSISCILGVFLLLQLTACNSLVTIPHLIIHILFSINTPEIGSGTVAQMGASETTCKVTLGGF